MRFSLKALCSWRRWPVSLSSANTVLARLRMRLASWASASASDLLSLMTWRYFRLKAPAHWLRQASWSALLAVCAGQRSFSFSVLAT